MFLKLPKVTTVLITPVLLGVGTLYALSFVENNWFCDLCNQLRLVFMVPLGLALLLAALRNNTLMAIGSTILLCAIGIPLFTIQGDKHTETAELKTISVVNFNTEFQHNNNITGFIQYCKEKKPDVIVLTESRQKWVDAIMEKLEPGVCMSIMKGPGISIFSNFPIQGSQVTYKGKSQHPQISAQLIVDNKIVHLSMLHLAAPQTISGYNDRISELSDLAAQLKETESPKIVLGDTNCANWSPPVQNFLKEANLKDTQDGFMMRPTWPARPGKVFGLPIPPFVPIDNIFVSKDFHVIDRVVGPALGSDHLPVYVKLQLNTKEKGTSS